MHQAKGMEAPVVIVDGYSFFALGDGVLASEESVYEAARVMYVALSRAERQLYVVTDKRDYPNMQSVYEIIDRQTGVNCTEAENRIDFSIEDARAFEIAFGGDV